MALELIVTLLSLAFFGNTVAVQCYSGVDSAMVVKVIQPLCGFRMSYQNDKCEDNSTKELTVEYEPRVYGMGEAKLKQMFKKGVCYYDQTILHCICYGHLCNDATHLKELLAMELARGALSSVRKLITCVLYRDEIKALFAESGLTPPTPSTLQTRPTETTTMEHTVELESTASPDFGKNQDKEKDDGHEEAGKGSQDLLMIALLTVGAIALLIIVLIILFLILTIMNIKERKRIMNSINEQEKGQSSVKPSYDRAGSGRSYRGQEKRPETSAAPSKKQENRPRNDARGEASVDPSREELHTAPNALRSSTIRPALNNLHKEPDLYANYSNSLDQL